jgi:pilus assembly protein CpaC
MTYFIRLTKLAAPFLVLGLCLPTGAAAAVRAMPPIDTGGQPALVVNISPGHPATRIVVPADKSRIVHFDQPFSRVHVGSGEIAEVVPLSTSTIYILGKKRGSTNLTITSANNNVVAVIDVIVSYDVDGLRQHLAELLPTESIEIQPAGDALVLTGRVSSSDHLRTIVAIAERYAPGAVTNLLSLSGSQQVLLEVKFAEVQRSALVQLGLDSLNGAAANNGISAPHLDGTSTAAQAFGTIGGLLTDSKTYFLRGQISALEQSGMIRTLAEPNIVSLSGEAATFLAGGEFPIPVVQSSTGTVPVTTIEYKDFGVGLSFTPTVVASDTIDLILKSEVSAIDPSTAVTTSGISVPGLKVRRATTTVELRNGQSFAIAGLIQDDFNDSLKALPGVGSIPIIGALLRSTSYQRNQTELVVFITVHLVGPGPQNNIALPTDRVVPPTPAQVLGLGHNEETRPPPAMPGARSMNDTPAEPPVASAAPAATVPATAQAYAPPPNAAPSTPVIVVPEKPVAQSPNSTNAPPPDVSVTPDKQSSAVVTPPKVASAAPLPTNAFDTIPIPRPKPSFAAPTAAKPALKAADAAPTPRKLTLAAVKPRAAMKPVPLPAADDELPVTAPDSIKAFRAAQTAAMQPDSSGTSP